MTKFSFKGFDWKKLLMGVKRPAIALIATALATLAVRPEWAWVAGIGAERVWATIEFYIKE
jgi:predicted N-acetyltransferase YhbS